MSALLKLIAVGAVVATGVSAIDPEVKVDTTLDFQKPMQMDPKLEALMAQMQPDMDEMLRNPQAAMQKLMDGLTDSSKRQQELLAHPSAQLLNEQLDGKIANLKQQLAMAEAGEEIDVLGNVTVLDEAEKAKKIEELEKEIVRLTTLTPLARRNEMQKIAAKDKDAAEVIGLMPEITKPMQLLAENANPEEMEAKMGESLDKMNGVIAKQMGKMPEKEKEQMKKMMAAVGESLHPSMGANFEKMLSGEGLTMEDIKKASKKMMSTHEALMKELKSRADLEEALEEELFEEELAEEIAEEELDKIIAEALLKKKLASMKKEEKEEARIEEIEKATVEQEDMEALD